MKLSALSGVVRKKHSIQVFTHETIGGEMVIGAGGAALYRCGIIPPVSGKGQIKALLSLTEKQLDKINIIEEQYSTNEDIHGYDLSDGQPASEQDTSETAIQFSYLGKSYTSLRTKDGEILFFEDIYLAPLREEMQSQYFTLKTRLYDDGFKRFYYIVAKDGFATLAAILPCTILSQEFIEELNNMSAECDNQFRLEQARIYACKEKREE